MIFPFIQQLEMGFCKIKKHLSRNFFLSNNINSKTSSMKKIKIALRNIIEYSIMFLQKLREKSHLFYTNIQYKCFLLLKK